MHVGAKGEALIKEFESCRLAAYRDQRGIWTCGWGATGPDISARTKWTQEQADARFDKDLEVREKQLVSYLGNAPTTQDQFDAIGDHTLHQKALGTSPRTREYHIAHYVQALAHLLDA